MRPAIPEIDRDRVVYSFDAAHLPLHRASAPAELMIRTHDARTGKLRHPDEVMATAPDFRDRFPKTNPATGPIYVEGANPGDSLSVEVLGIELDAYGFLIVKPDFGLVRGLVNAPVAKILQVADGNITFDGLRFPARPMIGVMATAPAGEPIATAYVGRHGGNMDNNRVTIGTKIHLPVRVAGALFYVGDLHASMGDGEVCGTGVEIGGRVHVKLGIERGRAREWPWMETRDKLIACASAKTYEEASEIAVREMMSLLGETLGLTAPDAFMLVSAIGDVRVNQACRSPIDVSVRVEVPKLHAGLARA
jgi:amidase